MADPSTLGVIISGLVGAYKAYAEYKAAATNATKNQDPNVQKSELASQGERVAPLVADVVERNGDEKGRSILLLFNDEPDTYSEPLTRLLLRLLEQDRAFAQQVYDLIPYLRNGEQAQGNSINISGGTIHGAVIGVNTGTVNNSYTSHKDADSRGTST